VEFEHEALGYAALVHRGVRRCVPDVYGIALRTREGWDGEQPSYGDASELFYGIVMESFEECREVDFKCLDVPTPRIIVQTLTRIHKANIHRGDIARRNMLFVKELGRVRVY